MNESERKYKMAKDLTPEELQDLRRAFDLTQDSGVVDQYGVKKMIQIFNMNPTTDDITRRYTQHNKDVSGAITFEEFVTMFMEYLKERPNVQTALSKTLADLFDGPVKKDELRKILVEMGTERFEPEEVDEIIEEITFDENDTVTQSGLQNFLENSVDMSQAISKPPTDPEHKEAPSTPEAADQSEPFIEDAPTIDDSGQVVEIN